MTQDAFDSSSGGRYPIVVSRSDHSRPKSYILVWRISLLPALQTQAIVKCAPPDFEAIWLCEHDMISVDDARAKDVGLYRSDPTFKYHRDPSGMSYVQMVISVSTPTLIGTALYLTI
jgi:hypothetical protein